MKSVSESFARTACPPAREASRLPDRKKDQLLQPPPGRAGSNIDFQNRWKSRQKHPAQLGIAGQESTDESTGFASAARRSEFQALRHDPLQLTLIVHGIDGRPAAENVRVAVRKNHHVARSKRNARALLQRGESLTFGKQVVSDYVTAGSPEIGRKNGRWRSADAPRGREFGVVIDCPLEFDRLENFGKHIHCRPNPPYRRLAKSPGRASKWFQ